MRSGRLARRLAATAGLAAIVSMGALTACAQEEEAPETTTETTTTTTTTTTPPATPPPVEPTEKAPRIDPGQPNPFSPTVHRSAGPDGHPWRPLVRRLRFVSARSPHRLGGDGIGRDVADGHVQRRLHESRIAAGLRQQVAALDGGEQSRCERFDVGIGA